MREHEVPTHLQAEDRVLLWLTFPQIVAVMAVCGLAYGAYSYAPGPFEVRVALAIAVGTLGIASIAGRIGGRGLPAVLADLLRFRLVPRRYAGTVGEIVQSEAPLQPRKEPRRLKQMSRMGRKALHRLARRKGRERKGSRMPFRPHRWFGERRKGSRTDRSSVDPKKQRKPLRIAIGVTALAVTLLMPGSVLADGHWLDEIDYVPLEPVPGRRLFVEALQVSGHTASVTLIAATDLDIQARAYGGYQGRQRLFTGTARLAQGESIEYDLPLSGDHPSLTFSWEDGLGQAGALSLEGDRLPYPLPTVDGEVCDVRVNSLGWRPGVVEGVLEPGCVASLEERMELTTVTGHQSISETAVVDARVTFVSGSVTVTTSESSAVVALVPGGETRFSAPVSEGGAVQYMGVETLVQASLEVDVPPLVRLTHHPQRTEQRTQTVSMERPGTGRTVSEWVKVEHDDGTSTSHRVSAYLSIPAETVEQDVILTIVHPEHVRAVVEERFPQSRSRSESLTVALSIGSDDTYEALELPEPEDEPEPAEQTPLSDDEAFDLLGYLEWRPW